jgi:diguanylate cyclase (GGDEF)-like protein
MPEGQINSFLKRAPMPMAVLDGQFRFREVNQFITQLDGIVAETHVGRTVGELLPDLAATINPVLERVLTTAESVQIEVAGRRSAPEEAARHWLISYIPITENSEVLMVAVETTECKRAEEALERARIELAAKTVELQHATWLDEMGRLLHTSIADAEAYRIIECFMSQFFPLDAGVLCMTHADKNSVEVVATWGEEPACASVFASDDCWALREGRLHQFNNATSTVECTHVLGALTSARLCVPLMAQMQPLGLLHLRRTEGGAFPESQLALANKVAEGIALALANLRLHETFRYQAQRDPLTGLYNRRYMEESLYRELRRATRKGVSLGMMMVDIDHFKQFNDAEGHAGGDLLLRSLAECIASNVRAEDIVCRYGGDEFSLILPGTSRQQLIKRADELREAIRQFTMQCQGKLRSGVTVSIGVAVFPDNGLNLHELMKAADDALYGAKAAGGDRVRTPRARGASPHRAVRAK